MGLQISADVFFESLIVDVELSHGFFLLSLRSLSEVSFELFIIVFEFIFDFFFHIIDLILSHGADEFWDPIIGEKIFVEA